jgi:hypothetical protein
MNGYIFIRRCTWLLVLLLCLAPAMAIADIQPQPPFAGQAKSAPANSSENGTTRNAEGIAEPNAEGVGPISEGNPPSHPPAGGMADIHDIKPIIPPKAHPMMAVWIAAAAVVLITLLALGRFLWKKRRGTAEIPTLTPELPPEENARLALDALAGERIVDGRRFYFRLSEILRRYLSERYGIGAPEMTPEELHPLVARLDLPAGQQGVLNTFWTRSEPVKFAGRAAVETEMADDLTQVRRFVAVTTEAAQLAEAATAADDGSHSPPGRREG